MRTLIVIPSRMQSTRLPKKPLRLLRGAGGDEVSLVERCFRAASMVEADELVVATDHEAIAEHVRGFGGRAILTPEACQNGTERCASLLEQTDADLIINFQGDAPLIPPDFVEALILHMQRHQDADIATPVMACDQTILNALRDDRRKGLVGGTTVSFNDDFRALYFSKEVIPIADQLVEAEPEIVHLHIGLYAYRREALAQYATWPMGRLERVEGLEQLRFLEHGKRVDCVPVQARGRAFWEVNLPDDIERVELALKQRGIE